MPSKALPHEKELLREIRQGKERAFLEIFENYHRALYGHVLRFAKSEEAAKDLTQEVFLKVWERRAFLDEELNFKAYLFKIGQNLVFNHLKKTAREYTLQKEIAHRLAPGHSQGEEDLEYREYETLANEAINLLPPKRQLVFRMCRLEGKDPEEIAASLHLSKHTIRDHLVKATKSVKNYLGHHSDLSLSLLLLFLGESQ